MNKFILTFCIFSLFYFCACSEDKQKIEKEIVVNDTTLSEPASIYDTNAIKPGPERDAIIYGYNLFNYTYKYLGPNGTVEHITKSEMSCKSCHLLGGIKPNGMPLFTAFARYPQYRAREDRILSINDRINNCLINPLSGHPIPLNSKEMYAFEMYLKWLWDVNGNKMKIRGDIPNKIDWQDKPADPEKGKNEYLRYCARCHGVDGQGVKNPVGGGYLYPPVWGEFSYALGSSMHRIGKLAAFIKYNMPNDKDELKIQLTDEECFNIAAFINYDKINPRPPYAMFDVFYPDSSKKAVDFPMGPYANPFSEEQHRFGPHKPIEEWRAKNKAK